MKFLIFFDFAYNGENLYDMSCAKSVVQMIEENKPSEIVVCTGPSQYTACRRAIAISNGWAYGKNISLYGFNILRDFIEQDRCFFAYGKLIWVKIYDEISIVNIANKDINLHEYVGNIDIDNNEVIDCSIYQIWKNFDKLKHELFQEYYDKFTF